MEAGTTVGGVIILSLKWLFPSLIGAVLAVWDKKNSVDWQSKTTSEKILTSLLGVLLICLGVAIAHALGGAIIETIKVTVTGFQFLIYMVCGLSSLKLIDAVIKNIDPILEIITKGLKDIVKGVVDSIVGKWRK